MQRFGANTCSRLGPWIIEVFAPDVNAIWGVTTASGPPASGEIASVPPGAGPHLIMRSPQRAAVVDVSHLGNVSGAFVHVNDLLSSRKPL